MYRSNYNTTTEFNINKEDKPQGKKLSLLVVLDIVVLGILLFVIIDVILKMAGKDPLAKIQHKWIKTLLQAGFVTMFITSIIYVAFRLIYRAPRGLNESILPVNAIFKEKLVPEAGGSDLINVKLSGVKPGAKVIYWANDVPNSAVSKELFSAYGNYSNGGVAIAESDGTVNMPIRNPVGYNVRFGPINKSLGAHVHYRVQTKDYELSEVKTLFI